MTFVSRCSVCNKPLSDPVSVERGMGPVCYAKFLEAQEKEGQETED